MVSLHEGEGGKSDYRQGLKAKFGADIGVVGLLRRRKDTRRMTDRWKVDGGHSSGAWPRIMAQ